MSGDVITLSELEVYLAEFLDTGIFDDYCVNGIQVEGSEEIRRIVTGVSASYRLFEAAADRNADAVLVHHGLFWKNSPHPMALRGFLRQRLKFLLDRNINLLGYHLPLDAHPVLGNNALIAKAINLQEIEFIPVENKGAFTGAIGKFAKPLAWEETVAVINQAMGVSGLSFAFGNREIQSVYVLSGGGGGYFSEALRLKADLLITGELNEDTVRAAEESGLALYAAGHYNSEKWGVRALGQHLAEKFNIQVEFVDIPNPV